MDSAKTSSAKRVMIIVAKIVVPAATVAAVAVTVAILKGWSLPSILAPLSRTSAQPSEPWCNEHGVEERLCTLCHTELKDTLLWCAEHDIAEDLCTLCHPDLASRYQTCAPHGLPAALCAQCNPADDAGGNNSLPNVRLAKPGTAGDVGVAVRPVESSRHVPTVECNAEVDYNLNRYAHVRPRVEGILREVRVDVGAQVRAGDVLAVIDSAALGEAKADFLASTALEHLASQELARVRKLVDDEVAPRKRLLEAEHRLKEALIRAAHARQTLLNLGLRPQEVERIAAQQDTGSLLQIIAPLDGVIVARHAVTGEPAHASSDLFSVADLSTMWVHLDMYENDLARVRLGQQAGFTAPSLQGVFRGAVTWISSEVDPRTRTVAVRVEVDNADRSLRVNMFGRGFVEVEEPHNTLTVPKEAVQSYEGAHVVFVKKSERTYETRRVDVGHQYGPVWEIVSGVNAGEQIVTTGSFLFKTELMRGSIGSGCCE